MIVFNFTGLNRIHWLPTFERAGGTPGIWYWSAKWLGVEVIASSKLMAAVMIYRLGLHDMDKMTTREARP